MSQIERKTQKQLDDMIADSKATAMKAVYSGSDRPKTLKEMEEFSKQGRKTYANSGDALAKKNDSLVQQTLERNKKMLEKAKALEEQLKLTTNRQQIQQNTKATELKGNSIVKDPANRPLDIQNSKAVPFEENPLFVNTVIQTSNPEDVKRVIDVLIGE